MEATLKRKKIVYDIEDALSKKPDIIFLVLTFSSVGISVNDAANKGKLISSIAESMNNSIKVLKTNKAKADPMSINEIPLVIFVTGVNYSNKSYQISSIQIPYPVTGKDNQLKANANKLKISV